MKRNILTMISLFLAILIGCQVYELSYRYQEEQLKLHETIEEAFQTAIKQELTLRLQRKKLEDPNNPRFIMRDAKEMTPEERAKLKGDTLRLSEAKELGIGNNFVDVFAQRLQEAVIRSGKPVRIVAVDSLFRQELVHRDLMVNTWVILLDSNRQVAESTDAFNEGKQSGVLTTVVPVGTSGFCFLQGYAELSFWRPLNRMRLALLLSGLVIVAAISTLVLLLRRIQRTRCELKERETAVHTAIHDLKAPLNITYSTLDLITLTEREPSRIRQLETGKRQIRLLTEVIESMLSLLRTPKDSCADLELEEVDLAALMDELLKVESQYHLEQRPHTLLTVSPDFPKWIRVSKIPLFRCLMNVVDNAMIYGDAPIQVEVRLSLVRSKIRIEVEDQGWGIPRSEMNRLGTPFFRVAHVGKPSPRGYGLGLSSLFWLMKVLHGEAHIQSVEGQGTTVTITIPYIPL